MYIIRDKKKRTLDREGYYEKHDVEYCHPVDPPLPCFYPINDKF